MQDTLSDRAHADPGIRCRCHRRAAAKSPGRFGFGWRTCRDSQVDGLAGHLPAPATGYPQIGLGEVPYACATAMLKGSARRREAAR